MITNNPFYGLQELMPVITPGVMQAFVVLMVVAVVVGVILDVLHKRSADYFNLHTERMKKFATRELGSAEKTNLMMQVISSEVLTSSEFHNPKRRLAHLLKMYGFIFFVLSSAVLIFFYADSPTAGFWAILWRIGAIMLAVGGWWFFTSLRVDVQSEGKKWYKDFVRADMFIISLLGVSTFGLLWCFFQNVGVSFLAGLFFVLFLISTIALFGGVYWSKFAHMFFKPAAAYQKRVFMADGSREHLPPFNRRKDVLSESTMDLVRDIPGDQKMGLCIMKDEPKHY